MKNKVTCKYCTSRYLGCHDECAEYQAFRKERNEILDLKNKTNSTLDTINDHRQRNYRKTFIHNGKRGTF